MYVTALTTFAWVMIPLGLITAVILVLAIYSEGLKQDVEGIVGDNSEET